MTITNDPAEDADFPDIDSPDIDLLDDEALIAAYVGDSGLKAGPGIDTDDTLPDWPPPRTRDIGLNIDVATLNWFKAQYADWRREMGVVLRAWVAAQREFESSPGKQLDSLTD
jgi:hypothetical protein